MKRFSLLVALLGVVFMSPSLSHAIDYTGQWRGTITQSVNECKNLARACP
jgi:hypothetical protein